MKKTVIAGALALALLGSSTTSCIGSFALFHKVLGWNEQVGNKIVNELVFIAFWIVPVYEVSWLADILVINSIEFWSGTNPMTASTKVVKGEDGDYLVKCDGKGYTITSQNDGTSVRLDFAVDTQTWSVAMPDGESYDLVTYVDPEHVSLPAADGERRIVELNDEGLMAYRSEVASNTTLWAAR